MAITVHYIKSATSDRVETDEAVQQFKKDNKLTYSPAQVVDFSQVKNGDEDYNAKTKGHWRLAINDYQPD